MVVYFIRAGNKGAIKIGVASDLAKRLETLQTGNPFELKVLATIPCSSEQHAYDLERRMHKLFASKRIRGEWFCGTINFLSVSNSIQIEESPVSNKHFDEYKLISDRIRENKAGHISGVQAKKMIRKSNEEKRMARARELAKNVMSKTEG